MTRQINYRCYGVTLFNAKTRYLEEKFCIFSVLALPSYAEYDVKSFLICLNVPSCSRHKPFYDIGNVCFTENNKNP